MISCAVRFRPKAKVLIVVASGAPVQGTTRPPDAIPPELAEAYDLECLLIVEGPAEAARTDSLLFPVTVLADPVHRGYGGCRKTAYRYAIDQDFDLVALLPGDGRCPPQCLVTLLAAASEGRAEAVFGSCPRTGMVTRIVNRLLRTSLSDFDPACRVFSVSALGRIPFELNSDGLAFDTEITIQLVLAGAAILEVPVPTGPAARRWANRFAFDRSAIQAATRARLQELGIFYHRKFDCVPAASDRYRQPKLSFESPHTAALDSVAPGSAALDLGCAGGYVSAALRSRKGCRVTGVDVHPPAQAGNVDEFISHDLNAGLPPLDFSRFDFILLLDVIEHLATPERFIDELRHAVSRASHVRILASTGNIGFFIVRFMLLLGQFNYGKRGILDLTHTRLFTFASFRRLFEQGGFRVVEQRAIPGPFPLALGDNRLARLLLRLNQAAIHLSKSLFAYQIYLVVEPMPSLELLAARGLPPQP